MVLLAPTLSALQKVLRYPLIYVISPLKLIRPKGPTSYFSSDVLLDGVTQCYVNEFQYLGHIDSVDYTDDTDIAKQVTRQNTVVAT